MLVSAYQHYPIHDIRAHVAAIGSISTSSREQGGNNEDADEAIQGPVHVHVPCVCADAATGWVRPRLTTETA